MMILPGYLIQGPLITYLLLFKEVVPGKQELVAGEMTLKVGRGELGYGSGRHKSSPKKDRFSWIMCLDLCSAKMENHFYVLRPVEGKAIFNHEIFQTAETQPAFLKLEDLSLPPCESCLEGQMRKGPFPVKGYRAKEPLELVHSDLSGPLNVKAGGGRDSSFYSECGSDLQDLLSSGEGVKLVYLISGLGDLEIDQEELLMRMVLKEELLTDEVKVRRMIEVQGRKSSRKRKEVKEEVKEEEGYIRGRKKKFKAQRMIEGVRRTIHINPDVRTLD
ncbi:gag/pol protein [Cucumis melo var. makuwa]|uniref:Gag/pol protein n=1 Tax=Cucumis melo var. makuwa TaxID=1194695 RepID=A0A5D3BZA0_CUCMM|nr:gag/pol protein [Cucumis melo var. makuwa]